MNKMSRDDVFDAINGERAYQVMKWGKDKQQSIPGFILVMERELLEAKEGWMKSIQTGRHSCLAEILQVAATAVACLEKYGEDGLATSTDDN